ncbi:MAG: hypothetical protein GY946_14670, partial [bacterium]|nr:hypothetical protein [bacterium]
LHSPIAATCNVVPGLNGTALPVGTNNEGTPSLNAYGQQIAPGVLVVNQCASGPATDILGTTRTGLFDRGAFEGTW